MTTASPHPALEPGRAAVITGAASGIGLATAKRMASLGLRVCLADRDAEALERAVAALGPDHEAFAHETDVADRRSVDALAEVVEKRFGPVSVLTVLCVL